MAIEARISGNAQKKENRSGSISWVQYYYDNAGIRRNASGETKKKAVELAHQRIKESNHNRLSSDDTRFEGFAEAFIEKSVSIGREGRRQMDFETARSYQHYFKEYVNPVIGTKRLTAITTADMRVLMESLILRTKTRTTAQKILTITKVVLRYAITLELIEVLPGSTLKIAQDWDKRADHLAARIPDEDSMRAIEKAAWASCSDPDWNVRNAYKRYYPLFLILRTTGVRISEALGLQWDDFNSDMTRVTIKRRVSVPAEGKDEEERIARPKTKNGIRTLPIAANVKDVLLAWKQDCADRGVEHPWLFAVKKGNPMNYSNVVTKFWLPLLDRAGVEHYGLHSLRHYYASLLINKGRYKELTSLLGHHSAAFTMDVYGHLLSAGDVLDDIADSVSSGLQTVEVDHGARRRN